VSDILISIKVIVVMLIVCTLLIWREENAVDLMPIMRSKVPPPQKLSWSRVVAVVIDSE
jgi:hypothetical protein